MAKKSKSKKAKHNISENLAIVALILNIVILPGLGTLIGGKKNEGVWQLVLYLGGFILGLLFTLTIIGAIIGIPMMFGAPLAAWIWGIFSGVDLIKESEKR